MRAIAALITIPMQLAGLTPLFSERAHQPPVRSEAVRADGGFHGPDAMWAPMTLLILVLLSPSSLPSVCRVGSPLPGERVAALAAALVADQGMILPANVPADLAPDAGEELTDDDVGPPLHLASRRADEFWRAIRASHAALDVRDWRPLRPLVHAALLRTSTRPMAVPDARIKGGSRAAGVMAGSRQAA